MNIREDHENVTQAMCDEAKGEHKHMLIGIGYTGLVSCYVDLTLEEAKRRYLEKNDSLDGVTITAFGFDDEFNSYEISEKD